VIRANSVTVLVAIGLVAAVGSTHAADSGVQPLAGSFCGQVVRGTVTPQYLIVSDLPLRFFPFRDKTLNFQAAIEYVLRKRHFRAGKYAVGYQPCDDSSPQAGSGALAKCASNATAYAGDPSVIGEVGTWNSVCSEAELPTLNQARGGPLALVSPTNTNVELTHAGGGTAAGDPARFYPTGKRNFARILSPDDAQGVAEALLARQLGVKRVFVLDDGSDYGLNVLTAFRATARKLRINIVGNRTWAPDQTTFDSAAAAVAKGGADAVYLAGAECPSCGELIKSLRSTLGPKPPIIVPDGFSADDMAQTAGPSAEGLYASVPGLPLNRLPAAGRRIEQLYGPPRLGSGGPSYAAQAAAVLLDAIAASNGTRASVSSHLLAVRIRHGLIGSFRFDKHGDPTFNPIMIFRVSRGKGRFDRLIVPPAKLIP
jgi:branched-chain amino acid transport system substrate-binding protein